MKKLFDLDFQPKLEINKINLESWSIGFPEDDPTAIIIVTVFKNPVLVTNRDKMSLTVKKQGRKLES